MGNILIFVEGNATLKKATLHAITAGQKLAKETGGEVHAVALAKDAAPLARAVKDYGIAQVHVGSAAHLEYYVAENYTPALCALATSLKAQWIVAAATATGRDLMPRVAARLKAAMVSDVLSIEATASGICVTKPMWAGAVIATLQMHSQVKCLTVRSTEFQAAKKTTPGEERHFTPAAPDKVLTRHLSFKAMKSTRPALTEARVVVSGGRGTKGDFRPIENLADALHAAVGASRAVCDAGWQPNDLQVGQTGKVVAPELYIAAGISGAIQHVAGMKGSKTIVAINKDPNAPIFQIADYGLVADLFQALPELQKAITQ